MLSYLEKSQGKHPKGLICWFQDTCETCHNKRFVYQNSCTNMKFSILMSAVFKLLRKTTGGGGVNISVMHWGSEVSKFKIIPHYWYDSMTSELWLKTYNI